MNGRDMNRIGYNLETRIRRIHVIQMTKNRVARRNNPAGYLPAPPTDPQVVAHTHRQGGGFLTGGTTRRGRAALPPASRAGTLSAIHDSVAGGAPNGLLQL